MDQMIVTAVLAAALLAPAARAGEPPKAAAAQTRAEAKELRLAIKKDKQALKQDWLDTRQEIAAIRARRGPARIALKQKLKSDQTRRKSLSKAR